MAHKIQYLTFIGKPMYTLAHYCGVVLVSETIYSLVYIICRLAISHASVVSKQCDFYGSTKRLTKAFVFYRKYCISKENIHVNFYYKSHNHKF